MKKKEVSTGLQIEVTTSPEISRLGGISLWGKNYQPFGAGDFEECMDGNLHTFE
jgi:hypothetical protein